MFDYADGGSYLNPKHEIRNPKQYLMIQIQMIKTRPWLELQVQALCLSHLIFGFVSYFDIRI